MSRHKSRQHKLKHSAPSVSRVEQEELVKLYQADGENTVDMTTLERRDHKRNVIVIFVTIIGLLSVIALGLGYLVFGAHRFSVNEGEVKLELTSAATIGSGGELTLNLHYINHSAVTIDHGTIELLAPDGFYFASSEPQPQADTANIWEVGSVAPGAEGTITVTGQLVGQKDDVKEFNSIFTYWPINFNSPFDVSAHQAVTVTDSIITAKAKAKEQAHTGEEFTYSFSFTNTSTLPLIKAKAVVQYPDGFKAKQAKPTANQGDNTWLYDEVKPGETKTVDITGDITGEGNSKQKFVLQVGLVQSDGFFNPQAEITDTVKVINPELNLKLSAPEFVQAGEKLDYTIDVENTSNVDITALTLTLDFDQAIFASKQITLEVIDKLAAGKKVTLKHTAVVPEDVSTDIKEIKAMLKVKQASVNELTVQFDQTSELTTKLQGNVTLEAQGRYYDDNLTKIGSGPIPPQVDQTTTYSIQWQVAASGGDMSTIKVQTTLPEGTTFVASSNSALSYDDTTRTVTLVVDTITSDKRYTTTFTVSVTPTSNDINKLLVLTNDTILTAVDAKSGETLQATANRTTTNIKHDPGASGDGTVQP